MTAENKKPSEAKSPSKDGKKKGDVEIPKELSMEDEALKEKLELLVTRVQDESPEVAKVALETLRDEIRTSTSSMTSVPKPLKFLLHHYAGLQLFYDKIVDPKRKTEVADLLSVLAMTAIDEDGNKRHVLKFRLESNTDFFGWGNQYVRHLAAQIGDEVNAHRLAESGDEGQPEEPPPKEEETDKEKKDGKEEEKKEKPKPPSKPLFKEEDVVALVPSIVKFYMESQSEPEAVDILLEVSKISTIVDFLDKFNYEKTCLYLAQCGEYFPYPEDEAVFKLIYDTYLKFESYVNALRMAMKLDSQDRVNEVMEKTKGDKVMRRQLGYLLGWQQFAYGFDEEDDDDEDMDDDDDDDDDDEEDEKEILEEIITNQKLCEAYHALATDLDVLEPKSPEDIYKENVTDTTGNVISAKKNLASCYVNAFVNAGFGRDKLMTGSTAATWIFQNKETGIQAAVASLGMIMLWDADSINEIDKYLDHADTYVRSGARLAVGIACAGMRSETNVALAILGESVDDKTRDERVASIFGLGLAYAGQAQEEILSALAPLVSADEDREIAAIASLALGMVYVGSCNEEIIGIIITDLIERAMENPENLKDHLFHFHALGLSLLFMGTGDSFEAALELVEEGIKTISPDLFRFISMCMEACAFVGTGNVLKIQNFLSVAGEHPEEEKDKEKKEGEEDEKKDGGGGGGNAGAAAGATEEKKEEEDEKPKPTVFYQMMAVVGVSMVSMGEEIGRGMVLRMFNHLIQYGEPSVKRAVPLALALISISNPDYTTADVLSKLTHDNDPDTSWAAILGLGLIGAGTNNSRISTMLRQLMEYYAKEPNHLFTVRVAQGLLHMGKGLLTLTPYHSDRFLQSKVAMCGLLTCLVSCFNMADNIFKSRNYFIYALVCAMKPRMLVTLDEKLQQINVPVRVGKALDVVAQAGKRKRITGFQQHDTPVLLSYGQRAELATEQYLSITPVLEGFCILKTNPEWEEEQKKKKEKKESEEAKAKAEKALSKSRPETVAPPPGTG